MLLPAVNFETKESILQSIEDVAVMLAGKVVLKFNEVYYRIIDFEFYVHTDSDEFQDKHTYKGALQKESNRLYLHYSGVDITFGDGKNYGGILMRGVVKLIENKDGYKKEKFQGPQKVATELFSNLYPLDSDQKNEIILADASEYIPAADFSSPVGIIKTKRAGLSESMDKIEFRDEPLRYIALFSAKENFNYKTKGLDSLIGKKYKEGAITEEKAIEVLGYAKKL